MDCLSERSSAASGSLAMLQRSQDVFPEKGTRGGLQGPRHPGICIGGGRSPNGDGPAASCERCPSDALRRRRDRQKQSRDVERCREEQYGTVRNGMEGSSCRETYAPFTVEQRVIAWLMCILFLMPSFEGNTQFIKNRWNMVKRYKTLESYYSKLACNACILGIQIHVTFQPSNFNKIKLQNIQTYLS